MELATVSSNGSRAGSAAGVSMCGSTFSLQPARRQMWCRMELMRCMASFQAQMEVARKAKLAKTNIATRSLSTASESSMDPAFKVIPKGCACLLIWRVENLQLAPVPNDQCGCFFDGDSYLILVALQGRDVSGSSTQVKEVRSSSLDVRIHFWLGENTTQVESGVAATKAAELDEYLGGNPVQYREVQGHESSIFLQYFKRLGGIRYTPGSHITGFSHVDHVVKPRLLHVKGKHYPRMTEVPIAWSSMNNADVYILDVGAVIYVWNGEVSNQTERIKALEYARKLRDDRGKCNIHVVNDGEENPQQLGEDAYQLFSEYLSPFTRSAIGTASQAKTDDTVKRKDHVLKLWRCCGDGNQLKLVEVAQAPLVKQSLEFNECYIVDNGDSGVWIWCGRAVSQRAKQEAMTNAGSFIIQRNYNHNIPLAKVHEGGEPAEFRSLFSCWDKERLPGQAKLSTSRIAQISVQTRFEASVMFENPQFAMETGMVDDGSGSKKIWRVERSKDGRYTTVELERKYNGQLFGGDCYIILYTYLVNKHTFHIVYYWLGKKSTQEEMGVAAYKAVEIDESLGGVAKLVRVMHGREPNHFLAMFGGRVVIFASGKAGLGSHHQDVYPEGPSDTYLLQVYGTAAFNTKAEQVPCRADSLNSNDVFVLFSKGGIFVWAGKGCTGDEREMAKHIASVSPRGYQMMTEGQEKEEFWNILGGRGEYSSTPQVQVDCEPRPPRLFLCSSDHGAGRLLEILDFTQQDLLPEDMFILDTYNNLYVWIGNETLCKDKSQPLDVGLRFVQIDPTGRPKDIPVFLIKQGLEPPDFIGYFGNWNREYWTTGRTYEQLQTELCKKNTSNVQSLTTQMNGESSFSELAKYPYEILSQKDKLPEVLDHNHKEKHLSSEEFQKVFSMTYAEFVMLPIWKQQQLKKRFQLW